MFKIFDFKVLSSTGVTEDDTNFRLFQHFHWIKFTIIVLSIFMLWPSFELAITVPCTKFANTWGKGICSNVCLWNSIKVCYCLLYITGNWDFFYCIFSPTGQGFLSPKLKSTSKMLISFIKFCFRTEFSELFSFKTF